MMRNRSLRRAAGDESQPHQQDRTQDELSPGRARERQQQGGHQDEQHHAAAHHLGEAADEHALEREQCGQYHEGAEHVGVVEGAAGATVAQEHVGNAAEQPEVGADGHQRGDHGRRDVAAHDEVEPLLGVGGERGGVEDRGHRQVGRHADPDHRLRLVDHLQHRHGVADIQENEQQQERRQRARQRQAGHSEHEDGEEPDDLVGARLDEHEGAGKRHQPQQRAAQRLDGEARPGRRAGERSERPARQLYGARA